jgi:4-hydroxyphenylpyruvate dioxygenase-like putative hemolysin
MYFFKKKKNNLHTIPNTYFTKVASSYCLEIEKMKTLETEICLIKKRDTKINLFLR